MDDVEKMNELEQEVEETVAEEGEEIVEETTEAVEEETADEEELAEEMPVEKTAEKGGSNILGIVAGLVLFVAFLAVVWMAPVGNSVRDTGVFYAKNEDLYFYDLKNEPYLVQEDISDGGGYHYFYSAWGAGVAEDGKVAYYMANVDATGAADLYRRDAKDPSAEAVLIDSNVYDYMTSKDGKVVAYLAMKGDSLELRYFEGGEKWVAAEGMKLENDVYSLSSDGRYLVYKDAYDMLCAKRTDSVETATKLTDDCPLYALTKDMGILYFVSKADTMYNIYSYDFKNEPELVAENAQYMELMPNGRDLLYGVKSTEVIPYSELLEDDMAEIDAKMTEDDPDYDQKLMRDDLRAAMESGEGLEPLLQEFYILSNGKATLVADNVVSAVAVKDSDKNFVTGYKAKAFQPLYLSVIGGGLEMVDMIYYMSINYGGMQPFLADAAGNVEVLTGSGVLPDTVKVSYDGSHAAYLATDEATGGNVLMEMEIGKAEEATAWEKNVEEFAYLGRSNELGYSFDYNNGSSIVRTDGVAHTMYAEGACGIQFVTDRQELYFIQYPDSTTGNGTLKGWKNEAYLDIDEDVFAFQYKGNGKLTYIKNYDLNTGLGDLYYFDGGTSRLLDTDITAIFMY